MAWNKGAAERALHRKNVWKIVRTVLECLIMAGAVFWVVWRLSTAPVKKTAATGGPVTAEEVMVTAAYIPAEEGVKLKREDAAVTETMQDGESRSFICISYNGVTTSQKLTSKVVSQKDFNAQIAALKASGYVTITQQDIINTYLYGETMPEKAMLLLLEDGIYETTTLARPALVEAGYKASVCTYANNLTQNEGLYITNENLNSLLSDPIWELGSNGYRLSYINVFDRYANYFGNLTLPEFLDIDEFLKRDYNHYLMDFICDEDRLPLETEEEMKERIAYDYDQMDVIYRNTVGYVPSLYVLMHSNTGAFANDPMVSDENKIHLTEIFGMNFNRQGTCLNTLASSIYDLSRLQSRSYFSTNHLMMRIWDDTGDDVAFVVGDADEAAKWYTDAGVTEYAEGNKIILTSLPHGIGRMTLRENMPADLDISVVLEGNVVGRQSIFMRSDRDAVDGLEVALEDNILYVREGEEELFNLDLFTFDGGPFVSQDEDEWDGLVVLQNTLIRNDEDPNRVREAELNLQKLLETPVMTLDGGGEPYVPELDISLRDHRELRIQLEGSRLNLWLDGQIVAEQLLVHASGDGALVLEAEVSENNERFSQANLDDDVYDAIFINLTVKSIDAEGKTRALYGYSDAPEELTTVRSVLRKIGQVFIDLF